MGFDVYGIDPKNDMGEYFRANIWYWRPLWDYVCSINKDIISKEDWQKGHYNDGYEIDEKRALKMAERIDKAIKRGEVAKAKQEYDNPNAEHPGQLIEDIFMKALNIEPPNMSHPFDISAVKEFGEFCKQSGGFKIW